MALRGLTGVVVFLSLGSIYVCEERKLESYKKAWEDCDYPPKSAYEPNTTGLSLCFLPNAQDDIEALCSTYLKGVNKTCKAIGDKTRKELLKHTDSLLRIMENITICTMTKMVVLPSTLQVLKEGKCEHLCSKKVAKKLCEMVLILSLSEFGPQLGDPGEDNTGDKVPDSSKKPDENEQNPKKTGGNTPDKNKKTGGKTPDENKKTGGKTPDENKKDSPKNEGKVQDPAKQTDGKVQGPAKQTDGKVQDPAKQTDGKAQDPAKQTDGKAQDPAKQTDGKVQDPAKQTDGKAQDPAKQTDGKATNQKGNAGVKAPDPKKNTNGKFHVGVLSYILLVLLIVMGIYIMYTCRSSVKSCFEDMTDNEPPSSNNDKGYSKLTSVKIS